MAKALTASPLPLYAELSLRVRLLYVAFTRPRDHLILAVPLLKKGPKMAWPDELRDEQGPLITLPKPDAAQPEIAVRGLGGRSTIIPRTWRLDARTPTEGSDHAPPAASPVRYWFTRPTPPANAAEVPPYRVTPSRAAEDSLAFPTPRVVAISRFTRRMTFTHASGTSWDAIGTALHAFLAADRHDLTHEARSDLAQRILTSADLGKIFKAETLLAANNAFRDYIETRWPGARWHRELPVSALLDTPHGLRRIEGSIDMLLETADGYIIVDHKSFPGRQDHWPEPALAYAPQLFTYAKAIRMTGAKVLAMLVHFTVGGGVVEVGE